MLAILPASKTTLPKSSNTYPNNTMIKPSHQAIVGDRVISYAKASYDKRGTIVAVLMHGRVEVRLINTGEVVTINRADMEVI